jgi:dolichol-phosphate mannosyltransferase
MLPATPSGAAPRVGCCRLSVVVPCYNEEAGLAELHRRVSAACHAAVGSSYAIILVDDGSSGGMWKHIEALVSDGAAVVGVRLQGTTVTNWRCQRD